MNRETVNPELLEQIVWAHIKRFSNFKVFLQRPQAKTGIDVAVRMDDGQVVPLNVAKMLVHGMWIDDNDVDEYEKLNKVAEELAKGMVKRLFSPTLIDK